MMRAVRLSLAAVSLMVVGAQLVGCSPSPTLSPCEAMGQRLQDALADVREELASDNLRVERVQSEMQGVISAASDARSTSLEKVRDELDAYVSATSEDESMIIAALETQPVDTVTISDSLDRVGIRAQSLVADCVAQYDQ